MFSTAGKHMRTPNWGGDRRCLKGMRWNMIDDMLLFSASAWAQRRTSTCICIHTCTHTSYIYIYKYTHTAYIIPSYVHIHICIHNSHNSHKLLICNIKINYIITYTHMYVHTHTHFETGSHYACSGTHYVDHAILEFRDPSACGVLGLKLCTTCPAGQFFSSGIWWKAIALL